MRGATNKWVAKYRRDGAFQGKASFGCDPCALAGRCQGCCVTGLAALVLIPVSQLLTPQRTVRLLVNCQLATPEVSELMRDVCAGTHTRC